MKSSRVDHLDNLKALLKDLDLAKDTLQFSFKACQKIGVKDNYTPQELVDFEAFAGRFSRTSDLLLQKVFRAIDSVELVGGGTLIDALHRAQKRNILDTLEQMYTIRELRNMIVHEYLPKGLVEIFDDLLIQTPVVLNLISKTSDYANELLLKA